MAIVGAKGNHSGRVAKLLVAAAIRAVGRGRRDATHHGARERAGAGTGLRRACEHAGGRDPVMKTEFRMTNDESSPLAQSAVERSTTFSPPFVIRHSPFVIPQRGFTLLEILLAILVFSIVKPRWGMTNG